MIDVLLRTMTESSWIILKLDWKTPGVFFIKRVGTLYEVTHLMLQSREHRPLLILKMESYCPLDLLSGFLCIYNFVHLVLPKLNNYFLAIVTLGQ